jgi:aromatic-L-amino-acid decarboxylase
VSVSDGLESDGRRLDTVLADVAKLLTGFVDGLEHAPVASAEPDLRLLGRLSRPPAEQAVSLESLLDVVSQAYPLGVDTANPRFFGYVPGGGLVTSAVAELITRVVNRATWVAEFAPGLVAVENGVIRWLCGLFGLPPSAGGLLTTGGSTAALAALVAARTDRLGDAAADGVLYLSDQAHHSIRKAARIAGLPVDRVRTVPTTADLGMDVSAAARMIAADRRAGLRPFLLVATAGTTNTGAVDPLAELTALASAQGLWSHVDACYGGFFQLTGRGRDRLTGIEQADSIALDPHKGLFLPYGTGALLVRDSTALAAAHALDSDYMPDLRDGGLPDFAHLGVELSREHRGLRLWLPLHLHGVGAFRAALDEKLDLAESAHRLLALNPRLELPYPPQLSTVVFRLRDAGAAANQDLLRRINSSNRVFLSGTRLHGRFTLRLCVLSHRSHGRHVAEAVDLVHRAADRANA